MIAVQEDQLLVILEREGLQQCRVDDAEDRRVPAEGERQRRHGDEREARAPPEQAKRIPDILPESTHRHPPPLSCAPALRLPPQLGFNFGRIAESLLSHAARLLRFHARARQLLGPKLQVELDLLADLLGLVVPQLPRAQ